ncbi:MAG TPA: DUF2807 domain-containing protein [Candidatus Dormibacteraeota bacterium]|nr:DUF2807 domain-containing protein [Candidatus Dormibacteraeota bacterium]
MRSATGRGLTGLAVLSLLVLGPLAACGPLDPDGGTTKVGSAPYEQGSGRLATASRTVGSFHAISAAQGVQVDVATGSPAITVTADDNLLPHVTTSVVDGVLVVDVAGSIETHHRLKVSIAAATAPDGLSASTGASVDSAVVASGALSVAASTGGQVHATGRVDSLTVTGAAGGSADLRDVEARVARIDLNAGSSAHVNVKEAVTGTCSAGATVVLRGKGSTAGLGVDRTSTLTHE